MQSSTGKSEMPSELNSNSTPSKRFIYPNPITTHQNKLLPSPTTPVVSFACAVAAATMDVLLLLSLLLSVQALSLARAAPSPTPTSPNLADSHLLKVSFSTKFPSLSSIRRFRSSVVEAYRMWYGRWPTGRIGAPARSGLWTCACGMRGGGGTGGWSSGSEQGRVVGR